jgi:hypothetical protein
MPKHISEKARKAGSWIMHKAKKLKKEHPNTKWQSLVKQAGAEYRKAHHKK